jgi:excisionase family DNA binding protein
VDDWLPLTRREALLVQLALYAAPLDAIGLEAAEDEVRALFHKCSGFVSRTGHAAPGSPPPPPGAGCVTVQQAAAMWRCTPEAVTKAIRAGRLRATRHGRQWLVDEADARRVAGERSQRRDGQPATRGRRAA